MSEARPSLIGMTNEEELHALYRFRGDRKRQPPLYIGRSNNVMRRVGEHRASKDWITQASRIDLEWYPAEDIAEAEREAIEHERPLYNIVYNGGRLKIEASAEVTIRPASPEDLAAMLAAFVALGMGAVWVMDSVANWNVKRRAERAGQEVDLPPARNLFTQDPPHWSANLLTALLAFATMDKSDREAGQERVIRATALAHFYAPRPE
jgi:predicted GIY-YIG superfamily endonuclease